uniref:Uncharacterized protein n=1 Tax=Chromera velia CCMP2878 TaxID=1169474 RepID=A0A0G4IB15_9ALVE|eukprot:Cvel_12608.t1-p1 / transcript=Cvel_12608.t1 / gene=Cvel_12608 / organism=Chromera_velia_CCMP2878 / gene_product=hypothetical protein / transcript_product=hypothetical protein / location=Cvel_scaffold832:25880-26404(+) / protein_length=175 / sequence_SO=supercontig / SO=protein_coding / is_pseudo=false
MVASRLCLSKALLIVFFLLVSLLSAILETHSVSISIEGRDLEYEHSDEAPVREEEHVISAEEKIDLLHDEIHLFKEMLDACTLDPPPQPPAASHPSILDLLAVIQHVAAAANTAAAAAAAAAAANASSAAAADSGPLPAIAATAQHIHGPVALFYPVLSPRMEVRDRLPGFSARP